MSALLELQDVAKAFGRVRAMDGVSLTVDRGEFFSLLGPSGCGTNTWLRLIAGFETPDADRVLLGSRHSFAERYPPLRKQDSHGMPKYRGG